MARLDLDRLIRSVTEDAITWIVTLVHENGTVWGLLGRSSGRLEAETVHPDETFKRVPISREKAIETLRKKLSEGWDLQSTDENVDADGTIPKDTKAALRRRRRG